MNRERIEERKWFAPEEKDFILSKSHGKCCHCGRRISVGKNFTVEHIIPISKGGTNDITSVVALCKECNDAKQDRIIEPSDYLKYLDKMYMEEVLENQLKYYEEFNWFSQKNFIPVDKRVIDVEMILPQPSRKKKNLSYLVHYTIDKATYADLDTIYEYIWKYNNKYGIESTRTGLKEPITDIFEHGAFYIIQNSSKELVAVILVALTITKMGGDRNYCTLTIKNPICMYNKNMYIEMITDCIMEIVIGASEQSFVSTGIPVKFEKCKADPVATKVYRLVGGEFGAYEFDAGSFKQSIILMNKNCGVHTDKSESYEDTLVSMVEDSSCTDEQFFNYLKEFSDNIMESLGTNMDNIIEW